MKVYINRNTKNIGIHQHKNIAALMVSDKDYPNNKFRLGELITEFIYMDFSDLIIRIKETYYTILFMEPGKITEEEIINRYRRIAQKYCVPEFLLHPYTEYSQMIQIYEQKFSVSSDIGSKEELIEVLYELASKVEEIERFRNVCLDVMEFCFMNEEVRSFDLLNKYYISTLKHPCLNKFNILTNRCYSYFPGDVDMELPYDITDVFEYMEELDWELYLGLLEMHEVEPVEAAYVELFACIELNPKIKKCKNCGRLFSARHSQQYCNRIFEKGKRCNEVGSGKSYTRSLKDDPLKKVYTSVYRTIKEERIVHEDMKVDYKKWRKEAYKMLNNARKKNMLPMTLEKRLYESWERSEDEYMRQFE